MKAIIVLFLLMLSISILSGIELLKIKGTGSLGLINGATLGIGLKKGEKPNRDRYVNAVYYTSDFLWYAGLNLEHRFYHSSHLYTLLTTGLDYVEMDSVSGDPGDGNSGDPDRYSSILLPHFTVGLGYQTTWTQDIELFIEWDIGIKASLSNINIGFIF